MTFAEIMQLKGKEAGLSFTAQQLEQFSAYYEPVSWARRCV